MPKVQIGSIDLELKRKDIKNLHISVLPPDGRVRVSAPLMMTDTAIRLAVIHRIPWIKKQQNGFANQPRQTERKYVGGETHYLWGKPYLLQVHHQTGKHYIDVTHKHLHLYINPNTSVENKAKVVDELYRNALKTEIENLLLHWQAKIGVKASDICIRKMKTRWGSCNIQTKRLTLNLELAKKPIECLEFVLVHELVHLLERHHNARFKAYMDTFLSDWRQRKKILNEMPLAFDEWQY